MAPRKAIIPKALEVLGFSQLDSSFVDDCAMASVIKP